MRFLILSLWAAVAVAHGADNSTSRILACAAVPADAARLSCYDGVARGLRSQPPPAAATGAPATAAPASAPAAAAVPRTPVADTGAAKRDFGLPPVKREIVEEVKSVKATVTATHHRPNGALVMELDNGQRWQQLGNADLGVQVGDSVTISRAMLGSFWMLPPSGRGSKVSRLR
ncbi:MAG: hypothetical protein JSR66_06765 [Proteobacteria bacterium]|nr:hypothetical protein [Pseudomonadota bacterium]